MEAPRLIPGPHSRPTNSADRPPANRIPLIRRSLPVASGGLCHAPSSGFANEILAERSLGWRSGQEKRGTSIFGAEALSAKAMISHTRRRVKRRCDHLNVISTNEAKSGPRKRPLPIFGRIPVREAVSFTGDPHETFSRLPRRRFCLARARRTRFRAGQQAAPDHVGGLRACGRG